MTGPSGAGKSSLLDAMAAVLVRPVKLRFNAAAQGTDTGDRDRSTLTYVRGAHKRETDEATGEVGTAYLRRGAAWSGIGLTFTDERGADATLLRLFHIRSGSTESSDLKTMYVFAPEAVDVLALKPYVETGIENRRVKAAFPAWDVYSSDAYTGFAAKFRRHLGMGTEQAQVLLHKTQSAKNLTNLDTLFREFMLDQPETFKLADETVEQFGELSQAHATVVDARKQVDALTPLRAQSEKLTELRSARDVLELEERHLDTWLRGRELAAAREDEGRLAPMVARLANELLAAERAAEAAEARRQQAQRAVDGSGGAQLGTLEQLRSMLERDRASLDAHAEQLRVAAGQLGLAFPSDSATVESFLADLARLGTEDDAKQAQISQARYEAMAESTRSRDEAARLTRELAALRQHRSNIDAKLLVVRDKLAGQLGVDPARLPFVGELVQVREAQAGWTGAIERVLGSFARTLVVPEQHYLAAAEFIDADFLGTRLVYQKVARVPEGPTLPEAGGSLLAKLELAETPHRAWLAERLTARFDYACVESTAEFRGLARAVTRRGQVKHSAELHEKDDRRRVDDRSRWVLGFTTEAKEAELERRLAEVAAAGERHGQLLDELDAAWKALGQRRRRAEQFERFTWRDVDPQPLVDRLADVDRQLDELRSEHHDLRRLEAELGDAQRVLAAASGLRDDLAVEHGKRGDELAALMESIEHLVAAIEAAPVVPPEADDALATLAQELHVPEQRLEVALRGAFRARSDHLMTQTGRASAAAVRAMGAYRRDWPGQAADWADTVEYLPEYLTRLDQLESDGLPSFEDRFFTLLQNQARNNISQLHMQIREASREIRSRVGEVNKSLLMTEFAPNEYLQIEVISRSLPDVAAFLATLNEITSGSVMDAVSMASTAERMEAEVRFRQMRALLERLSSEDPADKAWRHRCLDTRQHVQFRAKVQDPDGSQVDVFTGSGGRSGGERQKLVTFCLAAALRFQLAPPGQLKPTYALVVIDEAFDKADHSFTQAGLEVFRSFGFQLLLATPMKMLQTIEDHVGGVVMVANQPGRGSTLQELPFDTSRPTIEVGPEVEQGVLL
ncbi:ATP-binding protein [Tessaracoccus lubricantis]|uniref:ATP-binding protein n=2 Tax=Tessaracoccus lubricantis TaxID=545543 RepID=A0ABP9F0A2_9ACTN